MRRGRLGIKKLKPSPPLGVGTKYCPIPAPPPLQGGKNQCEGGGGEGKIAIPKFLEATWYISWCILVHSTFHSLHQNGKQAYYITKQFLEGVPMRYIKQGFLRKNKDTSSKHYKVSIIFYFLFLIMGGSLVHIQILVLLFLKLETFFFLWVET